MKDVRGVIGEVSSIEGIQFAKLEGCTFTLRDVDYEAIHKVIQRLRSFGMVESARELEAAIGDEEK